MPVVSRRGAGTLAVAPVLRSKNDVRGLNKLVAPDVVELVVDRDELLHAGYVLVALSGGALRREVWQPKLDLGIRDGRVRDRTW